MRGAAAARGARGGGFWERRAGQLRRQVQAKEERIVELETENAILHGKLAERRREAAWRGRGGAAGPGRLQQDTRVAWGQLRRQAQELGAETRELRAAALGLLRGCGDQLQACAADIAAAVQRAQPHMEALRAQRLQELEERRGPERRRRRPPRGRCVEPRGDIRVHCRVRPLLAFDRDVAGPHAQSSSASGEVTLAVDDETLLVRCSRPGHPLVDKTYSFERVYGPAEPQEAVFAGVSPLLAALLDGHDVCVMAYGQTGSGKSHTMLGPPSTEDPGGMGIVPRAARELFRLLSGDPAGSLEADLSVLEVYNNGLFDLLAKDGGAATPGVRPAVTTRAGRTEVSPLTREAVHSAAELMSHVGGALQRRARLATGVHAHSSRSHLVVTVTLSTRAAGGGAGGPQPGCGLPGEQRDPPAQPVGGRRWSRVGRTSPGPPGYLPKSPPGPAEQQQVWAKMQLVDLAGSECAGVSAVAGAALREAACINRSLAALADVLGALAARRGHVPYRNSRLTHLLQDALGGDAELLLVLCVSPCARHVAETLQSLGFGARARQAQRGAARAGAAAPRRPGRRGGEARRPAGPAATPPCAQ